MYNLYQSAAAATVNPSNVNPNWQLARSPPQQQQQPTDQQRGYSNGQNVSSQQATSTGASNTGGRSASTSGPSGQTGAGNGGGPPITPQYTLNGGVPAAYAAYGAPTGWIPGPQQIASPQTNIPPQMNAAYNVMYDPSQQVPSQQPTYVHQNPYETAAYFTQQSQQQQQQQQQQPPPPPQQGVDTVQQGNYNR